MDLTAFSCLSRQLGKHTKICALALMSSYEYCKWESSRLKWYRGSSLFCWKQLNLWGHLWEVFFSGNLNILCRKEMRPESFKCKGAYINMHRAVQHFHPGELLYKIFYYIYIYLKNFFFFHREEVSSRVSCTRERPDTSDCCTCALGSKSHGIIPQKEKAEWEKKKKNNLCFVHKLFNPNLSIITLWYVLVDFDWYKIWPHLLFGQIYLLYRRRGKHQFEVRAEVQRRHSSHTCFGFCPLLGCIPCAWYLCWLKE